jgi:hypothetical protein
VAGHFNALIKKIADLLKVSAESIEAQNKAVAATASAEKAK